MVERIESAKRGEQDVSLAATDLVAYPDGHVDRGVSSKVSKLKGLPEPKYDGPATLCNVICTWTSRTELANSFSFA